MGTAANYDVGAAPGKIPLYENFVGSGFQGLKVTDRIWVKRDKDYLGQYADLWVSRNVDADATGTDSGVSSSIRIDHTINKSGLNSGEWGLTVNMVYDLNGGSGGSGQHVSVYGRVEKHSPGALWAACFEMRDFTSSPTGSSVGQEITMGATGLDPMDQRIGLHISMYSANDLPGTNEIGCGLVIGGPSTHVRARRGIKLEGAMAYGIDFTSMDLNYADRALLLKTGQYIEWADSFSGTRRGSIHWNPSFGTMVFGGIKTATTAGASAGYATVVINGYARKIQLYQE